MKHVSADQLLPVKGARCIAFNIIHLKLQFAIRRENTKYKHTLYMLQDENPQVGNCERNKLFEVNS
jgi:hypothetical protein